MRLKILIAISFLFTNTYVIALSESIESNIFNSNSKLYYEIGGANRISPPISNNASLQLGLDADANFGYSCGEFDYGASFKNLMNGFKNGVDDVKNALINGVQAGVSSLPLSILQRARPGVYDMFQEWSADAKTQIDIATKSCEQLESEIARGENPYADFIQIGKAQSWKNKAASGDDIVSAKEAVERSPTKDGVKSYGGESVGGQGQKPLQIVASTVGAGYNFVQGSSDANANTTPNSNSELYKYFKTKQAAVNFATDVLGEYEINNEQPITKVGLGLYPKVAEEREKAQSQLNNLEYDKLGINSHIQTKLNNRFNKEQQNTLLGNIVDDIALQRVVKKSLIIRSILITGEQDPNANNKLTNEQRIKAVAKLDAEIKSLMFEREIRQKLVNHTIIKILDAPKNITDTSTKPEGSLLL